VSISEGKARHASFSPLVDQNAGNQDSYQQFAWIAPSVGSRLFEGTPADISPGHSKADVTQICAEWDMAEAAEIMWQVG